ncbi:U11/U12 small nuclear ribonucleoprotein 25 kDa protein isoform X2 [Lactuca sativa]|uniref:U11/U12 small nuclear ribonucleoprotein 25 kDa protein isoform X2 n=1 Tax=Lactuca sativa TaxID=4236 RepID=UPI000CD8BFBE|nr:U11/U12 small nuclear ribonucleoprotein 25 kDa protein isoform X2 [Lactuca sativa]
MTEPTSSSIEDDNVVLEYNNNNVKKAKLNSTLAALLDDPVLADVPKNPTLSDVDTLISLELGSAMRVSVIKMDNTSFDVAVMNSAKVKDLKLAVEKKVNEMEQSKMGSMCGEISASHITMKSFLMMMEFFKIMAYVITLRCILWHIS